MWKLAIASTLMIAGLTANAERLPARQFGLPPETGYLEAVTEGEKCTQGRDVLLTNDKRFIVNCDRSVIGWVTVKLSGGYLRPRPVASFEDPHAEQEYVLNNDGTYIVLYTCTPGESRDEEMAHFPQIKPSRTGIANFRLLEKMRRKQKNFRVQLFFNEWVLSGKCLGDIKPL